MDIQNRELIQELAASGEYKTVPVSCEILSNICTPIQALRILQNVSRHCYLLESAEDHQKWGRYTFLGYDPKMELTCKDGMMKVRSGSSLTFPVTHPGETIRQVIADNRAPKLPGLPPFTGGLVGYFSYDYIKYAEPSLQLDAADAEGFQDVDLMP